MKRFSLLLLVVILFAACTNDSIEELQSPIGTENYVPESITVGFEGDGDETRIQLQNGKTVWTKNDQVSVFYRSNANQKWQYYGETGSRTAELTCVDAGEATEQINRVVVLYPYNESYFFNTETFNVQTTLPAEQTYLEDSYGLDGNIMVSFGEFNQFKLKTVYGWLKLQLTGNGEQVKSITVRGNNGEQVAGEAYINTTDATMTLAADKLATDDDGEVSDSLIFEDTILKEVTLNCVDGVSLGAEATAFYIALPPQTFTKGLTVEITATNGLVMTKSTDNSIVIERNHIQPMTTFVYDGVRPQLNNEIWYTATAKVEPYDKTVFGATYVSNEWDSETGIGGITFDDDVTMIGERAFYGRDENLHETDPFRLTSVTIPDSVTTIGEWAFGYCENLTSVTIPHSVTTIGNRAFYDCYSLTSITIPDSVTRIGDWAFYSCSSLKSVTIPYSVTTIGESVFAHCYRLTSVNIPNSVTTIGDGAFFNCWNLTNVIIPNSVTTIGNRAFYDCNSLTSVTIPDSVTTIGNRAFQYCSNLTRVTIPDSVTTIGDYAFALCDSLTSVTIPDSVTTIGNYAFSSCDSLTSVYCKATTPPALGGTYVFDANGSGRKIYVPYQSLEAYKTATYWSEYADDIVGYDFENGEIVEVQPNNEIWYTSSDYNVVTPYYNTNFGAKITSNEFNNVKGVITFDGDVTTIGDDAFGWCKSLTSVIIPDSVTTIGKNAFYHCSSLLGVNIPDNVTSIGEYAFCECYRLKSVNIPDSVTTIGYSAFEDCEKVTSVTIGDSVTTIGNKAFYRCSLKSVTIPDSVTTIGDSAFYANGGLTSVYCKATTPPALGGTYVFDYNGSGRKIYVPAASVEAYKGATNWSKYASAIVGYDFETGVVVE